MEVPFERIGMDLIGPLERSARGLEAEIFSGISRDGKQNCYELHDSDGTGKNLIGSGRDQE